MKPFHFYLHVAQGCTLENPVGISQYGCVWTQPFTSARVRTKKSTRGSWKYGRIEVRAMLPRGNFLWPAIWMLPTDQEYGTWAASGEIDIMEARGQLNALSKVEGTLHYGAMWPNNVYEGSGPTSFPGLQHMLAWQQGSHPGPHSGRGPSRYR